LRRLLGTWFFLPRPPHRLRPFKAALKVVVAEAKALDDPEDLDRETTTQKPLARTPMSGQPDLQ
jgi:hypothetical protein